jgi:hypothetical protein
MNVHATAFVQGLALACAVSILLTGQSRNRHRAGVDGLPSIGSQMSIKK